MQRRKNAWINLAVLAATLFINTLGGLGIINGRTQKDVSDMYPTLITPGPSTFSIWSVIYTLLIISLVVMIVKTKDSYYKLAVDEISGLFRVSCIFNVAWIVSFSFVLVEISVLFIFGFLISLVLINRKLQGLHENNRWLLPLTFGLYGGWLFIATVVNVASALVKMNWSGFGLSDSFWANLMLIVSIFLLIGVLTQIRNAAMPLPIAWAYLGINQYLKAPDGYNGAFPVLETTSIVGMVVLVILSVLLFVRNSYSVFPK